MLLAPGTRLGPYEVVARIGAGGMGDVYRARDTRLDRTVAIKVLPEHLAKDAKTELQEIMNKRRKKLPEYRTVATRGAGPPWPPRSECPWSAVRTSSDVPRSVAAMRRSSSSSARATAAA